MATINVDNVTEIDETGGNARVEWGEGNPMVIWNEHLKFHTERLDEGETLGDPETLPGLVHAELERLFKVEGIAEDFEVHASWADQDNEDGHPFMEIAVWLKRDLDPEMEQDTAYGILWPAIATLFNVTDPGTFNHEYLFTRLVEMN